MRRLIRILFNSLAVLSLGLAVVFAALWRQSYVEGGIYCGYAVPYLVGDAWPTPESVGKTPEEFHQGHWDWPYSVGYGIEALDGHLWVGAKELPTELTKDFGSHFYFIADRKRWDTHLVQTFDFTWDAASDWGQFGGVWARYLLFPVWLPILPLMAWPLPVWIARYLRRRRINSQRCPDCGYDLRASPDRCPECGTVATAT